MAPNMEWKTAHSNLICIALNAEQRAMTCGYWYLVQQMAGTPHTAFRTRQGLERWLEERGLKCNIPTAVQPEDYGKDMINYAAIEGIYGERMMWDVEEFYALPAVVKSKALSNGDYVEAFITEEDGVRVVNTLNPNVQGRKTFPHAETHKEMS
jgi:LPS sulfotransferase NodH